MAFAVAINCLAGAKLAVACVLALGNIGDRMEKGLSQQSREFMAGDRALRSSREVPQAWLEEAQSAA